MTVLANRQGQRSLPLAKSAPGSRRSDEIWSPPNKAEGGKQATCVSGLRESGNRSCAGVHEGAFFLAIVGKLLWLRQERSRTHYRIRLFARSS